MQYLALMIGGSKSDSTEEQWSHFFDVANNSGIFRGGSALGESSVIGPASHVGSGLVGFMRFEADTIDAVHDLLQSHPMVINGGSIKVYHCPVG